MNKFNVRDRVWCCMFGWGEVTKTTTSYISVKFDKFPHNHHIENIVIFTLDGKYSSDDIKPTLFHDEVKDWPNPQKPVDWNTVAVDTLVWVRDNLKQTWIKRYFSKYENNKFYCWGHGATSQTTYERILWNEYSLTKPE